MSTSAHPAAQGGETGEQHQQVGSQSDQTARPGRRPRGSKDESKTLDLDFTGKEDLLADLRALAQVMKFDLNDYVLAAVEAKHKSDTERVRKEFNAKSRQ